MYCVLPLFLIFFSLVNPRSLFTPAFSLRYTERKPFMLVRMGIKYELAVRIMQVNIRSKLVHCKGWQMFPTNPFWRRYCCNGYLFGILVQILGINIDPVAASAATMWLLAELRKLLLLRRKWPDLYRLSQKSCYEFLSIVLYKRCEETTFSNLCILDSLVDRVVDCPTRIQVAIIVLR
jgi:hypothetical protein